MQETQLQKMSQEIVQVYQQYERTGTKPWTYSIATKDLVYQVGSLMKLVMQHDGERFVLESDKSVLKEKIGDELADILAEVLFVAHELDINVETAWQNMIASDSSKIASRT